MQAAKQAPLRTLRAGACGVRMKRIETTQEALAAANQALDLIKAIQAAKIRGVVADDALDVSLASARSDLEFVSRRLESEAMGGEEKSK